MAFTTNNATLLAQVLFPMQTDYENILPSAQKHAMFQEQVGLCGLFSLYNGYSLMNITKPVTKQKSQDLWRHFSLVQIFRNLFYENVPVDHLDYFTKFEAFFLEKSSLAALENLKKTYLADNTRKPTDGIGRLNKNHLNTVIAAHPRLAINKSNILITSVKKIKEGLNKSWQKKDRCLDEILQAAHRLRRCAHKPLLVILRIDKDCHNNNAVNSHWIALLFTKDVTWIADSCNHQDNMLVHDPDIHFVDAFFRIMPLPPVLLDDALATEQDTDCYQNFSQELLECFATQPGTVFSKPQTTT
jgi:hypothetical protein